MEKYKILVKGIVMYEDKYLVVERWYDDRIVDPYQWEFIDGKIEFGEAPDKGVLRIIQEQTKLTAQIDRVLYTWSFMLGDTWNLGISYLCLTAQEDVVLPEELNNYKWITREEFDECIGNKNILKDLEDIDLGF